MDRVRCNQGTQGRPETRPERGRRPRPPNRRRTIHRRGTRPGPGSDTDRCREAYRSRRIAEASRRTLVEGEGLGMVRRCRADRRLQLPAADGSQHDRDVAGGDIRPEDDRSGTRMGRAGWLQQPAGVCAVSGLEGRSRGPQATDGRVPDDCRRGMACASCSCRFAIVPSPAASPTWASRMIRCRACITAAGSPARV